MNRKDLYLIYFLTGFNLVFFFLNYRLRLRSFWLSLRYILDSRIDLIVKNNRDNKRKNNLKILLDEIKFLKTRFSLTNQNENWLIECLEKGGELIHMVYNIRPYKSQMQTALSLFKEYNVELPTGEGKTVSLLLASFLSYMADRKVFILTVNDYLVRREANWAQKFWGKLNVKVMGLTSDANEENFKNTLEAYSGNNFVVSYLNNQKIIFDFIEGLSSNGWVHQGIFDSQLYCDEVDLVLIDNVNSPFVISAQPYGTEYKMLRDAYDIFQVMKINLHFVLENQKSVNITEEGYQLIEDLLINEGIIDEGKDLYTNRNGRYLIFIRDCILAHYKMKNNIDYLVKDNRIYVLNELTGRIEYGKNFNYPMNSFLELKEKLPFSQNYAVTASVFYQSFFNLFRWRSGTTGTLMEAQREFERMYQIPCLTVRPNYRSRMKIRNLISNFSYSKAALSAFKQIEFYHPKGTPILVIASDMYYLNKLEELLSDKKWVYKRLDAHNIEEEDAIIDQAGTKDNITLSSNVTGRGVDIVLGGTVKRSEEDPLSDNSYRNLISKMYRERTWINLKGGLLVIALGLNLSNRIDRQIYGRCARQGYQGTVQPIINFRDQTATDKMAFPLNILNHMRSYLSGRLIKTIMQRVITHANEISRIQQYRDNLISFQHYHSFRDCRQILTLTHSLMHLRKQDQLKNKRLIYLNLVNSIMRIVAALNIEHMDQVKLAMLIRQSNTMLDIRTNLIIRLSECVSRWSAAYQAQLQNINNYAWLRSVYRDPLEMVFMNSEMIKDQIIEQFGNHYSQILTGMHCVIEPANSSN